MYLGAITEHTIDLFDSEEIVIINNHPYFMQESKR